MGRWGQWEAWQPQHSRENRGWSCACGCKGNWWNRQRCRKCGQFWDRQESGGRWNSGRSRDSWGSWDSWEAWDADSWQEEQEKLYYAALETLLQAAKKVYHMDQGDEYPELEALVLKVTKGVQDHLKPPSKTQLEQEFQSLTQKKKDRQENLVRMQKEKSNFEWSAWTLKDKISGVEKELQQFEVRGKELLKLLQPQDEQNFEMEIEEPTAGTVETQECCSGTQQETQESVTPDRDQARAEVSQKSGRKDRDSGTDRDRDKAGKDGREERSRSPKGEDQVCK